jgi:acetoin utilization deacetylase AcuC-like enzyme
MTAFHTDEYIDFLSRVSPDNMDSYAKEQLKCTYCPNGVLFHLPRVDMHDASKTNTKGIILNNTTRTVNVGDDCPIFEGLFEYCQLSSGGSMGNGLLVFQGCFYQRKVIATYRALFLTLPEYNFCAIWVPWLTHCRGSCKIE